MSFAQRFEELEIWQQARALNKNVYVLLKNCDDYSFRDQMRRASLSVMNNISEGFERRTKKDFAHFLDLAKGSAGEVRSMTLHDFCCRGRRYFCEERCTAFAW
jgi:four helix bundle protein